MAIKFPDKIEHNNPNLKVVDVEQVDGALGLLDANYTYTVNNDYSLNQALADAARYKPNEGFFIQILIDSEYTITEPVVINGGDYSHVIITTFNEVRSVSLSNNQNLFNLSNCIPFRLTNVRFEIISNSEFNSFIVAQNCNQILWQGVTCVNFHFRPVQLRTCQGRISNLIIDGANQTFGIAALWVYDNSLISFSNIQINNYDRAITIDSNTKVFIFQLQFTNGLSTPIGISVQNSELILRSANFRTIANEDSVNDLVLTGEARVFISANSQGGVYSNPNTIANSSIIVDARKNYPFTFDNDIVTTRPQVVKHTSDLTGNIQEWRNLSDDILASFNALGQLTLANATDDTHAVSLGQALELIYPPISVTADDFVIKDLQFYKIEFTGLSPKTFTFTTTAGAPQVATLIEIYNRSPYYITITADGTARILSEYGGNNGIVYLAPFGICYAKRINGVDYFLSGNFGTPKTERLLILHEARVQADLGTGVDYESLRILIKNAI